MAVIENYNCEGMCQEECCDEKYTHMIKIKIHGMFMMVLFCEEHHNEFQNKYNGARDNICNMENKKHYEEKDGRD